MVQKCHGLKFQSVLVPDRFIACLFGPVAAKTHMQDFYKRVGCWINWRRSCPMMVAQQFIHYMVTYSLCTVHLFDWWISQC